MSDTDDAPTVVEASHQGETIDVPTTMTPEDYSGDDIGTVAIDRLFVDSGGKIYAEYYGREDNQLVSFEYVPGSMYVDEHWDGRIIDKDVYSSAEQARENPPGDGEIVWERSGGES